MILALDDAYRSRAVRIARGCGQALRAWHYTGTGMFGLALDRSSLRSCRGRDGCAGFRRCWLGTLPYFIADEWLTRGASAPRGSYLVTKICFLLSLALRGRAHMQKLFFLVHHQCPSSLMLFVISGVVQPAGCTGEPTTPSSAPIANAVALSWAVAATLPLLAR